MELIVLLIAILIGALVANKAALACTDIFPRRC